MVPNFARSEEGLHHLQHCREDQCLQLPWGQQLDCLQLQEPLRKQAHELPNDVLDVKRKDEQQKLARQQGALWKQPGLSSLFFLFLVVGASSVVALVLRFLASASAALVFLNSEATVGTLGFEPVILAGKTIGCTSCLGASGSATAGFFFFLAAILGSMPGRPKALRFSASL